jgi:Ca2+-binding EF-hand superfamily protein
LATNIVNIYDKASEAFKAFDIRQTGLISFSDFLSGVVDLKLAGPTFTKDVIL